MKNRELDHPYEKYVKLEKLGEGTYASVYRAQHLSTQAIVAIKEIKLNPEEGAPSTAIREISLMKELHHPNIIQLLDVIHTDKILSLVFEHMQLDLKRFIDKQKGQIPCHTIQMFMKNILSGIQYCHEQKVLHRDLKPQNILLARDGTLKLADFGLARASGIPVSGFSSEVVTLWYRPPDVLLGSTNYDTSIDIWSVGCIFAELYKGKPLFPGRNKEDQLLLIFKVLGFPDEVSWPNITKYPNYHKLLAFHTSKTVGTALDLVIPNMDPTAIDLLSKMLQVHPDHRISAKDALFHPYFAPDLAFN